MATHHAKLLGVTAAAPRVRKITSRIEMIAALDCVRTKHLPVMEAVAMIEAWGEDFAQRNIQDFKRIALQKKLYGPGSAPFEL